MFLRRTVKTVNGKEYVNHLLVESVRTPDGPRHRTFCSLGSLAPAPREQWLALAHRIESALGGQLDLDPDERVDELVERARGKGGRRGDRRRRRVGGDGDFGLVSVRTDLVTTEHHREAGPVHVGHQMWAKLGLGEILERVGLPPRARLLTELMTLCRLVHPSSEHAMPDVVRRTALSDVLGGDFATLADDSLYRNLDYLHPQRAAIEQALTERERTLFNLEDSIYLYDLTSTFFEGKCLLNPSAQRGYSRDQRPDCKQIVVGLVLDPHGFPKAHEIFEGNRTDRTTVDSMLEVLETRTGRKGGSTVVVDRGMAFDDNLAEIRGHGHHYIVACRPSERDDHLDDFEDEECWHEVIREPSPRNPGQKKSQVWIKRKVVGDEVHVLCRSDGRKEKDQAIRDKHEKRLVADLEKLRARVSGGRLRAEAKIHQAIGRLRERYPRVARYHDIAFDATAHTITWSVRSDRMEKAQRLDGAYLLKTDRKDLDDEEVWRTYMLLTRVESAFRSMKGPLAERPIFHHLQRRVETHVFLCVLAYHLLVAIEHAFLEAGIHTSWATLRHQLSTHQVCTIVLPTSSGAILKIRKGGTPDPVHSDIYRTLGITEETMKPVKTWHEL
jgi:transposase